jgi:hypothetical protein
LADFLQDLKKASRSMPYKSRYLETHVKEVLKFNSIVSEKRNNIIE